MFKKFFVAFLAFAMVSVQASAVSNNSLKAAFDELNYSLSVEWDQKDRAFYDAQMKKFTDTVQELQAKGMSNADLVAFATANIKDKNLAKEVQTAMSLVQINKLSGAEARKLVLDTVGKNYSAGASWSSDGVLYGALIVLLIVAAVAGAGSYGGTRGGGGGVGCYDDYVCYDYYDSWGYFWYSDCYWDTYCY